MCTHSHSTHTTLLCNMLRRHTQPYTYAQRAQCTTQLFTVRNKHTQPPANIRSCSRDTSDCAPASKPLPVLLSPLTPARRPSETDTAAATAASRVLPLLLGTGTPAAAAVYKGWCSNSSAGKRSRGSGYNSCVLPCREGSFTANTRNVGSRD